MEAFLQAFDQTLMERRRGRRQLVIAPKAISSLHNEARPAEIGQVPGSGRLRDPRNADDVTYAEFAVQKQVKDSQPRGVGERFEHQIDILLAHNLYSPKRI
jgi:hypothetical protein